MVKTICPNILNCADFPVKCDYCRFGFGKKSYYEPV